MDKTVRDIMTPDPVGVYFDQTIGETARIMRDEAVGAVLVVSGESLTGVVTDRDLVVRGLAAGLSPDDPVGPLCSPKLVGVAADADVLPPDADGDAPPLVLLALLHAAASSAQAAATTGSRIFDRWRGLPLSAFMGWPNLRSSYGHCGKIIYYSSRNSRLYEASGQCPAAR